MGSLFWRLGPRSLPAQQEEVGSPGPPSLTLVQGVCLSLEAQVQEEVVSRGLLPPVPLSWEGGEASSAPRCLPPPLQWVLPTSQTCPPGPSLLCPSISTKETNAETECLARGHPAQQQGQAVCCACLCCHQPQTEVPQALGEGEEGW